MREYLFELRKKANKTQAEINKIFIEKHNCKIPYSYIETGSMWKDLSGKRAEMLAEALETTPDYILECEKRYGGFIGMRHVSYVDNAHRIRNGRCTDYEAPLTKEEQDLAVKYYSYAERIIAICRSRYYKYQLKMLITYEDYYDIGILAYLRSIKKLSIKRIEDAEFMATLDNPDYYYRHWFSKAIKTSYSKYIKSETTLRRKNFYDALILDSTIQGKDDSETEQYNLVPSKDLSVYRIAESTWSLDMLYKYLTETQILACKLLISEWTIPEIIQGDFATKTDIGVIRFYLMQFKQYGKVLWIREKFKSDASNVRYSMSHNRWEVKIVYKSKNYYLGEYADLNTALDLHTLLHFHLQKGDFLQWYESHLKPCKNSPYAFTYPLPDAPESIDESCITPKHPNSGKFIHATRENPKGITFYKERNTYAVHFGKYGFGTYKTFDEAFEIRQLAEAHYCSGDFDLWYVDFTEKREKKRLSYASLDKRCYKGKILYAVVRRYNYKTTRLGLYPYDEALQIKALADSHIDAGDIDKWAADFYADYLNKSKVKKYDSMRKTSKAAKSDLSYTAVYVICKYICAKYILLCYDTCGSEHLVCETTDVEEAYKTMDLANEHIEAGDFNAWFADYKNI